MKWYERQEEFLKSCPYRLEYDDDKHKYIVDGKEVPSVNKIIDKVFSREYRGDPFYGEIGTASAKAIELDLREDLDESSIDEYVKPRLEAFRKWKEEKEAEVLYAEMPLYANGIAGRFDGLFKLGNANWLIDYKCVKQLQHFTVKIQLAGYSELIHHNNILEYLPRFAALQLKEDGTYHFEPYAIDPKLWDATMTLYQEKMK